jgi:hypothetical protein
MYINQNLLNVHDSNNWLREREALLDRIALKIKEFIETFINGMGGSV